MVALHAQPTIVAERFADLFEAVDEILLAERAIGREPAGVSYAAIAAARRYLRALANRTSSQDVEYIHAYRDLRAAWYATQEAKKTTICDWAAWYAADRVHQLAIFENRGFLFVRESKNLLKGLARVTCD